MTFPTINKPGGGRKPLFDIERARALRAEGKTYEEVAAVFGMKSINYVKKRLAETPNPEFVGHLKCRPVNHRTSAGLQRWAKNLDHKIESVDRDIFEICQELRSLKRGREDYLASKNDPTAIRKSSAGVYGILQKYHSLNDRAAEAQMALDELRKFIDTEIILTTRLSLASPESETADVKP
jgi:hypothetical protein